VPRLYLSASIANAPVNARLRALLAPTFELVLPQEFTPDVEHVHLSRAIVTRCLDEMEACDAALVLLDALGIDCAMECGWLAARNKPLVAIAGSSLQFARHWMVKGTVRAVIALDRVVEQAVREDPILRHVLVRGCDGWSGVARALADVLPSITPSTKTRAHDPEVVS
jgi:nucleoside 2-deoxyribosyltransferase